MCNMSDAADLFDDNYGMAACYCTILALKMPLIIIKTDDKWRKTTVFTFAFCL